MGDKVALGRAPVKAGKAIIVKPKSTEDRLSVLEDMVATLLDLNSRLMNGEKPEESLNAYNSMPKNRDGVPIGISLLGQSRHGPRILSVTKSGYYVGPDEYQSLSAAAEAVSGIVRKSGWVFWKLPNGKSLKEAYKVGR